ncbi:breast cancer associated RING 1 [Striga asiatica]|uniref:Breast cancer associated RING 1 n=1 Tax=Striga asiatica TaxID=4170 RepID=A0A5A7RBY3_STRAF|nr:breast cancer associated RING 1 [Striga asiatica]
MVLCIMTSRTVMFDTQAFVSSFPSPPMLMPCPGPQLMLCMYTFELRMSTSLEFCKCIPSVFGLLPGDETVKLYTDTPMQLSNFRWHCALFWIVMPVTVTLKLPGSSSKGELSHQTAPFPSIKPLPLIVSPTSLENSSHWRRPEPQGPELLGAIIYGPENEMGPTRNTYSAGTFITEASTLQAAAHAAWNAYDQLPVAAMVAVELPEEGFSQLQLAAMTAVELPEEGFLQLQLAAMEAGFCRLSPMSSNSSCITSLHLRTLLITIHANANNLVWCIAFCRISWNNPVLVNV